MIKFKIIVLLITFNIWQIFGCDMFMLQSINNNPFLTLPSQAHMFDDPYDYFENFKTLSTSSVNRDGYGIIAYTFQSNLVNRDNIWYKTGIGNHFDENNLDEPLYQAIHYLYDNPNIERVLVHARSGTGGIGSHPFLFDYDNHTYSFMHNGYVFSNVKRAIMNFLGPDWFQEHPSQWQGNYGDAYSFIDSELIFHYLMYYIKQYPDDIPRALRLAFNNKNVEDVDMEYVFKYHNNSIVNIVFSDGNDTYVYRSSPLAGETYNLSYQVYPDEFIAVKTSSNLENVITKNQLLKITSQGHIDSLDISPLLSTNFLEKYVEKISENQLRLNWKIQSNSNINYFNIYRSSNQNFTNAQKITKVMLETSIQTDFNIYDSIDSQVEQYYWIEIVYLDNSSEITSNIPSSQPYNPPDVEPASEIISLYPNPFSKELNIAIDSHNNYEIKIYNLRGQLVKTLSIMPGNEVTKWNSSNGLSSEIANGIYIIKLKSPTKSYTKKIIRLN